MSWETKLLAAFRSAKNKQLLAAAIKQHFADESAETRQVVSAWIDDISEHMMRYEKHISAEISQYDYFTFDLDNELREINDRFIRDKIHFINQNMLDEIIPQYNLSDGQSVSRGNYHGDPAAPDDVLAGWKRKAGRLNTFRDDPSGIDRGQIGGHHKQAHLTICDQSKIGSNSYYDDFMSKVSTGMNSQKLWGASEGFGSQSAEYINKMIGRNARPDIRPDAISMSRRMYDRDISESVTGYETDSRPQRRYNMGPLYDKTAARIHRRYTKQN